MEGPWGTGSKQAVDLVFDQKVWAMLGSHDGRNAHLVEQVSAKTRVPYMSAWSGDPTLARAFIPWFFSCVPDDDCQASAIFDEIYVKKKLNRVTLISDNTYDSKSLEKSFLKKINETGKTGTVEFTIYNPAGDLNGLADSVKKAQSGCIVIFSRPAVALRLLKRLKERNMALPVFGPIELMDENEGRQEDFREFGNLAVVAPYGINDPVYDAFRKEYFKAYSKYPGAVASFAYDGMRMIINAIRESGVPDYLKIQKSLMSMDYKGVTGIIRFDDKGNRTGPCKLAYFVNLIP
jgi:branched-chain amino acid transport system substrate-binding protein